MVSFSHFVRLLVYFASRTRCQTSETKETDGFTASVRARRAALAVLAQQGVSPRFEHAMRCCAGRNGATVDKLKKIAASFEGAVRLGLVIEVFPAPRPPVGPEKFRASLWAQLQQVGSDGKTVLQRSVRTLLPLCCAVLFFVLSFTCRSALCNSRVEWCLCCRTSTWRDGTQEFWRNSRSWARTSSSRSTPMWRSRTGWSRLLIRCVFAIVFALLCFDLFALMCL